MELTQHQFPTSFPPVLNGVKLVKTNVLFAGYRGNGLEVLIIMVGGRDRVIG